MESARSFTFGVVDYVLFGLMLMVSSGVGVYFGFFGKRSNTTDEYLWGSNRLKVLPTGISLAASQLSAITIIAIPAEIYAFGANEMFCAASICVCISVAYWITTPIFFNNRISNCYEYLELRFDKKTRNAMTAIFVVTVCLCLPVYPIVSALVFTQVTGVNIHLVNGIVCFICAFYTMVGGIKAVVWTDVIQAIVMLGSMLLICALAIYKMNGLEEVMKHVSEGGRFSLNTSFDLTTRSTVWNVFTGYAFMWTSYVGFNQSTVQRIAALPSLDHARRALLVFAAGFIVIHVFSYTLGFLLFARYHDCDLLKAGVVTQPDKLMVFFVEDVVGFLSGMPGIFLSAVFSASISSVSAYLNSLSGIVYFDYIKPFVVHTERKANFIMKAVVFVFGLYSFLGGIVISDSKSMLQVMLTALGVSHGAILGTFFLGMCVPRAHGSAGFYGMLFSLGFMTWMIVGSQIKLKSGELFYTPLPTRVDGCDAHNITVLDLSSLNTSLSSEDTKIELSFYTISYHWYKVIGAICVWIVAIPMSYLTTPSKDKKLNPKLLAPFVRRYLPTEKTSPEELRRFLPREKTSPEELPIYKNQMCGS